MKILALLCVIFLAAIFAQGQILAPSLSEKLAVVPIFVLTDETGAFLTVQNSAPDQNGKVISLFFTLAEAQNYLAQLKAADPVLARKLKVTISDLAAARTRQLQEQTVSPSTVWRYVAQPAQVTAAQKLIAPDSQEKPQPDDVPLFAARTTKGYLTITNNGKNVIPLFFSLADLQTTLTELRRNSPFLAFAAQIQVLPLATVLDQLATDATLNADKIIFAPLPDANVTAEKPPPATPAKPPAKRKPI